MILEVSSTIMYSPQACNITCGCRPEYDQSIKSRRRQSPLPVSDSQFKHVRCWSKGITLLEVLESRVFQRDGYLFRL